MDDWSRSNGRIERPPSPRRIYILRREHTAAVAGGMAAASIAVGAGLWVGPVDNGEATQLLAAMMPTLRFFAFAALSASATVLLLMLTLFSVSIGSPRRLRPEHYVRIKHLAAAASVVLLGSIPLMLMLVLTPSLRFSPAVYSDWFVAEYVLLLAAVALLGGLLVGVMVMLYQALRDVIDAAGLDVDLELAERERS
jgi:hypothetical protein